MYQSVADGIGDCRVWKQGVPFAGRILRRYDYGSFLASVLDDFHKVGLFRVPSLFRTFLSSILGREKSFNKFKKCFELSAKVITILFRSSSQNRKALGILS
jgi:hypothetical protein